MKIYFKSTIKKFLKEENKLFFKYFNIFILVISIPLVLFMNPTLIIFSSNIFLVHSLLGIESVFIDYFHHNNMKIINIIIARMSLLCLNFLIYSFII
nr:succinate:cytochrome c oxidoreductase subunit 4 [Cyanidiaceae sp.]